MMSLESPIWKELSSAGNDADRLLRDLIGGRGELHEAIEILAEDLTHQLPYYSATAYVLPHLAALCPSLSKRDSGKWASTNSQPGSKSLKRPWKRPEC